MIGVAKRLNQRGSPSFLEGANGNIVNQIKRCQSQLKWWNQRVFGNMNTRLKKLKERLQFLKDWKLLTKTVSEIQGLKKEINETLHREEVMWNQRSRALWLKCGDRNTKFFHVATSQRCKRNKIDGITKEGVHYKRQKDIKRVILGYFLNIYSSDHPRSFDACLSAGNPRVTQEMNNELVRAFREEEIRVALNQVHPTKAPSPDGMSPIFFKKYWDVVG